MTMQLETSPSATGSKDSSISLLLCGGGTGGHVYPALSVAAALRRLEPVSKATPPQAATPSASRSAAPGDSGQRGAPKDARAFEQAASASAIRSLYVGSVGGMEERIVAQESDLPFRALPAAALRGRAPWTVARNLLTMLRGVAAARRLIAQERPAAILGTGGYVCVPLFLAARQKGVPTLIYLPDIVPGLAVKFLARLATRVACSFEESRRYLPAEKVVPTGYPVRPELFALDKQECRAVFSLHTELPVLLVYGGSRGARSINRAVRDILPELLQMAQVLHICGREGDESWLREAASALPGELQARYHLFPYLHNTMTQAFGAADLTLCRSGASTLGELPAVGLPAVLVPYPYVHQDENADFMVSQGAAVKIDDAALQGAGEPGAGPLFQTLRRLLQDDQAREELARRCRALAQPAAAERLASVLLELAGYAPPAR